LTFSDLKLISPLLRAVEAQGYVTPTPIQQASIPHVLAGTDLCGQAQTGTGKTAAFALPMLQLLDGAPSNGRIRALVLAPTRELAAQIGDSFRAASKFLPRMRSTVIFGGVGQGNQVKAIRDGIDVLIATPGRLIDLGGQGLVDLRHVEILVLDEADRMLDMGFLPDVRRILRVLPRERQTLFFSATFPREIEELARELLINPVRVSIEPETPTVAKVEQSLYFVDKTEKRNLLIDLLLVPEMDRAIVFSRTKHGANRIAEYLSEGGIRAEAIHGNKSQGARERALENFRGGNTPVLVATDIAARGIDVQGVSHVINFDLPNEPETYVHRIGRTARAGASGIAISLVEAGEVPFLRDIERLIGFKVPVAGGKMHSAADIAAAPNPVAQVRRQGGGGRFGGGGGGRPGGGRHGGGGRGGGRSSDPRSASW
jgi:ATP-dependent RNA helicase RhlE